MNAAQRARLERIAATLDKRSGTSTEERTLPPIDLNNPDLVDFACAWIGWVAGDEPRPPNDHPGAPPGWATDTWEPWRAERTP